MPQMSPLAWMWLMIMFILSIILVNSMMYFNKKYLNKMNMMGKKENKINWKW
uniref:ATP synthase complex subunit 8 n=1 Tax=Gigantometra gigas TaxID=95701 RepID=A0A3T0UBG6_9HEMI|nr:ATP synthase F0 subunit 8 [Gigantometra gigas]AZZ73258.1 ATP synthase F0 subunit 8 [Gigantometra gigas]AZZ73271.1 ATP synthase F0 subunit 8 [Gigantometra gigas]